MKFFKKITSFKGGKAEKEVGLAVPSVAVVSAVALNKFGTTPTPTLAVAVCKPVATPESQDSDSIAHEAPSAASKEHQNESQYSDSQKIIVASHVQAEDEQIDSIDEEEEYRKAMEENIYLKEKNSLLLQLVS
jgi:hypothetical protein